MIERCENPKHIGFKYYGERGITVCARWRASFPDFLADMGLKPAPRLTIDRLDNAKGYEPGNCRWATPAVQRANQRPYDEGARVLAAWVGRSRVANNRVDLTGETFGRLLVLGFDHATDRRAFWRCRCACGADVVAMGKSLKNGNKKSCGCLNSDVARTRAIERNKTDNPARYRWG
jgi:hypothetical protein